MCIPLDSPRRFARRLWLAFVLALLAAGSVPAASSTGEEGLIAEPVFGSRVHVERAGRPGAPSVVLVHGLGPEAGYSWAQVVEALDDRYRVLVVHLPGFGRSTSPQHGALTPANYARMLHWLIERESLDDVRLVGHSMGGAIALAYAAEHPERLHNLTLVSAVGVLHNAAYVATVVDRSIDLPPLPAPFERPARRTMSALRGLIQELVTLPGLAEFLRSDGVLVDLLGRPMAVRAALALMESDFSSALARIAVPVTAIWGENDRIAPLRTAHLLDGRLTNSRLYRLPNAGHMPMLDDPAAFHMALSSALAYRGEGSTRPHGAAAAADDYRCDGAVGATVSGNFDLIVIEDCTGVVLRDVQARQIAIRDSSVRLTGVRVDARGTGPALSVDGSAVTATDLRLRGAPAVVINDSRLDAAAAVFHARDAAIEVGEPSSFILSVSLMRSGRYTGYLHGTADAARTILDEFPGVRSAADRLEVAAGPGPRIGAAPAVEEFGIRRVNLRID